MDRSYSLFSCFVSPTNNHFVVDVWSVGCVFAELIGGRVLFPGKQLVEQMNLIINVLGSPSDAMISKLKSKRSQAYLRNLPKKNKVPFSSLFPRASQSALDLLDRMLQFDPSKRITVVEALRHPYLAVHFKEKDLVSIAHGAQFSDCLPLDAMDAGRSRAASS